MQSTAPTFSMPEPELSSASRSPPSFPAALTPGQRSNQPSYFPTPEDRNTLDTPKVPSGRTRSPSAPSSQPLPSPTQSHSRSPSAPYPGQPTSANNNLSPNSGYPPRSPRSVREDGTPSPSRSRAPSASHSAGGGGAAGYPPSPENSKPKAPVNTQPGPIQPIAPSAVPYAPRAYSPDRGSIRSSVFSKRRGGCHGFNPFCALCCGSCCTFFACNC